jgi:ABC-2 type transport system permease protein
VRQAIRAEWAKKWSDPGTPWLLAGIVAATVAVSAVTIGTSRCPGAGCGQDPARISLAGVYLGQAAAALAGVLAIGGEYGSGMIRMTLAAVPRRGRLLAAKALVVAGLVLAAAVLAVAASMLAGYFILPGRGFTPAHGFDLASGATWRAACCAAAYLTLVALLGLGVATAARDSAAATGITLGVLYLLPIAATVVASHTIQLRLLQISPMLAGMYSQATVGLRGLPLTPWQGLGVVALWAAGALVLGGLVFRRRDA